MRNLFCTLIVVQLLPCCKRGDLSETFFRPSRKNSVYLINKVHSGIRYRVVPDPKCFKQEEAEARVQDSLLTWLSALNDAQKSGALSFINDSEGRTLKLAAPRAVSSDEDVTVHFKCEEGVGYTSTLESPMAVYFFRKLFMGDKRDLASDRVVDTFQFATVLHEMGHAFGLGDVTLEATSLKMTKRESSFFIVSMYRRKLRTFTIALRRIDLTRRAKAV